MELLIKRYGNRKLYNTEESRYITLDEIARLVRRGRDVKVVDNESGGDLTAVTFAQIILEEEKKRSRLLPLPLLRELVQAGEATIQELVNRVDKSIEAIGSMREKAGRRVQEIVAPRGNDDKGKGFLDELLAGPQKKLEALQKNIDERIKKSVDRITAHPAFQKEVRRIERSIKNLELRIARLRSVGVEQRDALSEVAAGEPATEPPEERSARDLAREQSGD